MVLCGYGLAVSKMGDLGRQFECMEDDDPQPLHPAFALDGVEQRPDAFLAWRRGRPDREIRERFQAEFRASDLSDGWIEAINEGRGPSVRDALARVSHVREESA